MKKTLTFLFFVFFSASAKSANIYKLDSNHSSVTWSASHFGFSEVSGKFTDLEGEIIIDEENLQKSSVEVLIKTNSISTGIRKFDDHLKGSDFFDVEKFPTAKFVSFAIVENGKNSAKIKGNLTLLGITKVIDLDVKLNKVDLNPINQKKTAGLSASTILKRSDFGMNFGIPGISDKIKIKIEVEGNLVSPITSVENIGKVPNSYEENSITPKITEWKIIPEKSLLEFKVNQDNSSVHGSFKRFSGKIYFDKNQLNKSKIAIDIDTSSVATSFAESLEILKSKTWLSVENFPNASFKAEKFTAISGGKSFRADGKLTIKGKSTPLSLEFVLEEYSANNAKAVGKAKIKRSSFEIGDRDPKKANDLKDEVEINFVVSAKKNAKTD
jgi:polyisoprenoid-binding protein YceI